jgi:hypothetical protein
MQPQFDIDNNEEKVRPERRHVVPGCATCEIHGKGVMPSHDASDRCESGKDAHCTCDLCF